MHRLHRRLHFRRRVDAGGALVVAGWGASTPAPGQPTVFVNEVSYNVHIVFGSVVDMADSTRDGQADQFQIDFDGDKLPDAVGKPMDTTGDGKPDVAGMDTTGDGHVDTYVDLVVGSDDGDYKARVLMQPSGDLQINLPADSRERVDIDVLMEAIEAWGVSYAAEQAADLKWATEHDFEVTACSIGALSLAPSPLMVDNNGDGVADVEQKLWRLPEPKRASFFTKGGPATVGEALADAEDTLSIRVKMSVTQASDTSDFTLVGFGETLSDFFGCVACRSARS